MAERRMFTKKVSDSDAFIEMPSTSQALYFHLNQGADDDGFNNQIQNAMFKAHASTDDLKILMMKNFIIRFESGVIVIKHWRMHNTLRKDRYTPTNFQEELSQLGLKENGAYTLGCQTVAKRLPQDSKGKESIDKDSIKKEKSQKKKFEPPTLEQVTEYAKEKEREDLAQQFYEYFTEGNWVDSQGKQVLNWKQKFLTWCRNNNKPNAKPTETYVADYTKDFEGVF